MKGIITKGIGGFFYVADEKQNIYETRIRGKVKKRVCPGDYVEFKEGMIEKVYKRSNLLYRPKIANLDQVLIVQSVQEPVYNLTLLDRFLVMVEAEELTPIIVINKTDLNNDKDLQKEFDLYRKIGYKVFFTSVKNNTGFEALKDVLHRKVNVLTGPSGAGKSSIINSLISKAQLKTGKISKKLKRGTHTTRHVELLPIQEGGWVADTPGFTSLDIKHIKPEELTFLFPEFLDYLPRCKFRSCSHTHEPGCAVKKALKEGEILKQRYESYLQFYQELTE